MSIEIKVLGTGCPKCKSLFVRTQKVVSEMGLDANIEKIEDIMKIMEFGILATPALVVDGEVKISGRLPSETEIKSLLN